MLISLNGPSVAVASVCMSVFNSVNVFVCLSSPGVAEVSVCVSVSKSVSVFVGLSSPAVAVVCRPWWSRCSSGVCVSVS